VTELLEELVARCGRGDHTAAAALVSRFRSYAMNLAVRILNDRHLAEDAVQEAFFTAFDRLDDLRTPAAFPGWLRQIVRTNAMRIGRRLESTSRACEPAEVHSPSPPQLAEREELRQVVRAALESLPARSRETAALFYLNELDHHRVADALNVPSGTVRRRLHDARRHLRDRLAGYLEPDEVQREHRCHEEDRPEL
jgi:RNA polymerase sigma-70 factor (ECF subfamily)